MKNIKKSKQISFFFNHITLLKVVFLLKEITNINFNSRKKREKYFTTHKLDLKRKNIKVK